VKPFFSIITPVLNGAAEAPGYFESLKDQTFISWEAIIVDDGSTDNTLEILDALIAGDSRYRTLHNELPRQVNGPYQARNVGLNRAQGKFVCFLDIDDRWPPYKLWEQAEMLLANPGLCLLYSSYIRVRTGESSGGIRHAPPLLKPHHCIYFANPVPMLTSCINKSLIAGIYFEPYHHEDYIFWHSVMQRLKPEEICVDPRPLGIYCVHDTSVSSNKIIAASWYWLCYRRFGYTIPQAIVAMIARMFLEIWSRANDVLGQKHPLHGFEGILSRKIKVDDPPSPNKKRLINSATTSRDPKK